MNLTYSNKTKIANFFIVFICIIPIIGGTGLNFLFNPILTWIPSFILIIISLSLCKSLPSYYNIVKLYLFWAFISIIRGFFTAENYWEWRQFFYGIGNVLLPAMVFLFKDPQIVNMILHRWTKWVLPIFCMTTFWTLPISAFHFTLAPIFIIGSLTPLMKNKWKIIIIFFLLLMLLGDWGARAQILKAALALGLSIIIVFKRICPLLFIKIIHWGLYIVPIILLTLGITGKYNIFSENQEKYAQQSKGISTELSADTRTFIYKEVIESAINNNYIIWGRTPARGNDSQAFGALNAEELKTGKYERYMNEVCHPNVFTWLGLLGLIPWCLIYLTSSYLAIYKSNSFYLKIIGIFIAFRFFLGWIEDMNEFSIYGLSVWISIGMGMSPFFRRMDDKLFISWYKNIFKN